MADFLVLNGPNLNRLGSRETSVYGSQSLADINTRLQTVAGELGHGIDFFQSNAEHALIERLHQAADQDVDCLIFNPAAFTHTSIALRDAVLAGELAMIEVHLSNPASREAFRHRSYFSDIAIGTICGLGAFGYECALLAADKRFG
ncbi:3-dehydroquinate dehydratase-2 [Natronospira proteinivora]|uniref:3-dehydroquinate dehydratase n=1 Tax=Natronospira proteinivora TaxID=1807133 RepID=A0ABT1GBD1_9GAMM|nr:type II 3-dehydroquinate dehydratase [Natronospira proteinivora]MCP1728608.1 3-dehydroquinate dehydratase-2 [Natronospira proteinivora]